jgi:hypothetical protein
MTSEPIGRRQPRVPLRIAFVAAILGLEGVLLLSAAVRAALSEEAFDLILSQAVVPIGQDALPVGIAALLLIAAAVSTIWARFLPFVLAVLLVNVSVGVMLIWVVGEIGWFLSQGTLAVLVISGRAWFGGQTRHTA